MVVMLPMVVAAAEATTRAVATARDTKYCSAVAEATVHALVAVEVPAEVPAASSKTEGPMATSMESALLSYHKTSEGKSQRWQGIHPFLTFLCSFSCSLSLTCLNIPFVIMNSFPQPESKLSCTRLFQTSLR
jgi:hypothetical protein